MRDVEFLRANTDRVIKITLPGPFTMSRQAKNEFYRDEEELVVDYAAAVNAEVRDLNRLRPGLPKVSTWRLGPHRCAGRFQHGHAVSSRFLCDSQ
jgi:hypothetical protein